MSEHVEQIEQELERLDQQSEQLFQECRIRTALRVAREATHTAKSHQLVTHYMRGLFDQMRIGHGLLEPRPTREAAVELILLLENEEQARRIQPDLDEGHYYWIRSWMTSCAYDNLAEATGSMVGYNSPGMHECINEGIQVCRQTGKLECIKCFRQYAADVYLAADDLAMVRHQCTTLLEYREDTDSKDRRWTGHEKLAWVNLLEGNLGRCLDELTRAFEMSQAENVYLKQRAQLGVAVNWDEARLLAGQDRFDWDELERNGTRGPDPGEWLKFELDQAKGDALAEIVAGNTSAAIETLTEWDRRLTELQCTKEWFEVRLRLIAAILLAGKRSRAESLARGLEARAHEGQDFLTLRRLSRLMDPSVPVCPVPVLAELDIGPFARRGVVQDRVELSGGESINHGLPENEEAAESESIPTPLGETLQELITQLSESIASDEAKAEILDRTLAMRAGDVEHPRDAAQLIHLTRFMINDRHGARRVWTWANEFRERFSDNALVLSVVADLGHYFRTADPGEFEEIQSADLEAWFRLSLTLDMHHARSFARAGNFFFDEGNIGEAERCFARAFRLSRTDGNIAQQLAGIYRETDRPRDALAVLDLCLREGCQDPDVAWEAGMTSLQLEQYDSLLTYVDRYQQLAGDQPWAHYYRGLALMHLGRSEEALEAIERERELASTAEPESTGGFHLDVVRACCLLDLDRQCDAEEALEQVLAVPLREVDYLSMSGLVRLLGSLWKRVAAWDAEHSQRQHLESRLLQAALMGDDYFNALRDRDEEINEGIHFFRVHLRQSLTESWSTSEGCLAGQEEWPYYEIEWGVLAPSASEGEFRVLAFQRRCAAGAVEVLAVDESEETYRDKPGVVWQGFRWCSEADDMEVDDPDLDGLELDEMSDDK